MNLDDPEDRVVAAGEYVLGTLDAASRRHLEARMTTDTDLRAEIYRWQDKLSPLASGVTPVEPDQSLWPSIAGRLTRIDTEAPAANDQVWRQLRRWQVTAGVSIAAAVLMATLLVVQLATPTPVRYLTLLQAPDTQRTGWIVESTAGEQIRLVALDPAKALPPGKSLQFWTKPDGAAGPTSLGLVRPGTNAGLPAARSPGIGSRQLFELTLEPENGSPTGLPTGPILFVGRSMQL